MRFTIWILLILLHFNYGFCKNEKMGARYELIKVITDFLLILNQPLRITTSTLCWDKDDFYHLTRSLIDNGFLTTPSKGKLSTYWPHEQQLFVVDMACENSYETLTTASNLNLMEYPFRWLIIQESNSTELSPNLNMYIRSKIYILQRNSDGYKIISKYRLGIYSKEYHTNEVAAWKDNEFKYYNRLIDARNRTNLMMETLNMSFVIISPEQAKHLLDGRDKHILAVTKVNYPLVLHVFDAVNATPHFLMRNTWGYKLPNETDFGGLMGDAQFKLADIFATSTFYVHDRIPYIDVIASTTPTKAKFIFRAPPLSYVKNVYVMPFHANVWLACFGILCISSIFFYVITLWEERNETFNKDNEAQNSVARLQPNFSDVLQIQIGAMCQQGSEAEPISGSGRVATIFLFICMLFLYTSYSANIVALLQSTTDSIRTLDDLLNSRIKLGVEDTPYNRYFFTAQPGKTQRAIYREKVSPPGKPENFMDIYTGVRRMREEYFAFHTECSAIYNIVSDTFQEHEKCGLMEIEYFNMFEPYFSIRKNTTYGELFKAALRKMGERGIVNCQINRIYLKKPPCANQGGNFLSVSLTDCYAAFFVFGIGISIATIVLIVEKMYYYKQCLKYQM